MLGGEICRRLVDRGKPVRALVRTTSDPAKVEALVGLGVEIVQGDLCDATTLRSACQGVSGVVSTASSMPFSYVPGENDIETVDHQGLIRLVDTAAAAGVHQFVYISFTMDNDFPLRNAKRAVEARLKEGGMGYTILRPSYFMEVWLSPAVGFDYANAQARIYGSGTGALSLISAGDVAQFAVACLDNPAARNATIDLGGPEALSQLQIVKAFEEVAGQPFTVEHVRLEALEEQQASVDDGMQQSFAGLMQTYGRGDAVEMTETLAMLPVRLTSVHEYAREVVGK
jgi:NADH dehydrogenase